MRPLPALRLGFVLAVVLAGSACTDDDKNTRPDPGSLLPGEQADSGLPAQPIDSGAAEAPRPDGAASPLAACVDRPGELPRPPTTELPCELLPPGFSR